ncbi:MAG: HAMP domain-containing protein, partial [Phycisphaerales bacterium]|nr:HAMP domain-containing protein [Phycisphaerales bacterium]
MRLRTKVLMIVGVAVICTVAVLYPILRHMVYGTTEEFERASILNDVTQAENALGPELASLTRTAIDYAVWDDTYRFMQGVDREQYLESNIELSTFSNNELDFIMFTDRDGAIVFGRTYEDDDEAILPLNETAAGLPKLYPSLIEIPTPARAIYGIVRFGEHTALVASHPILRGDRGGPAAGMLVIGKIFGDTELDRMIALTELDLDVMRLDDNTRPDDVRIIQNELTDPTQRRARPIDDRRIAGYTLLTDLRGRPELILRVVQRREIYRTGKSILLWVGLILILGGSAFAMITVALLEYLVLRRISRFARIVHEIGSRGDPTARVPVQGRDEITDLAEVLNQTFKALEQSQELMQYVGKHARCIFWSATVDASSAGEYVWD